MAKKKAISAPNKVKPAKAPSAPKAGGNIDHAKLGQQLSEASHDRTKFDALLREYERSYKPADLRKVASHFTGYDITKSKARDVAKAMRNWQREAELNHDIHAAQEKLYDKEEAAGRRHEERLTKFRANEAAASNSPKPATNGLRGALDKVQSHFTGRAYDAGKMNIAQDYMGRSTDAEKQAFAERANKGYAEDIENRLKAHQASSAPKAGGKAASATKPSTQGGPIGPAKTEGELRERISKGLYGKKYSKLGGGDKFDVDERVRNSPRQDDFRKAQAVAVEAAKPETQLSTLEKESQQRLAQGRYGKSYEALSEAERYDVNDRAKFNAKTKMYQLRDKQLGIKPPPSEKELLARVDKLVAEAKGGPKGFQNEANLESALKTQGKVKGIKGKGGLLGLGIATGMTAYAAAQALKSSPAEASTLQKAGAAAKAGGSEALAQGGELAKWTGAGLVAAGAGKLLSKAGLVTAGKIIGSKLLGPAGLALSAYQAVDYARENLPKELNEMRMRNYKQGKGYRLLEDSSMSLPGEERSTVKDTAAHLQLIREKGSKTSATQNQVIAGSLMRTRAIMQANARNAANSAKSTAPAISAPVQASANASTTGEGYYAHRAGKLTFIHGKPFGGKGGKK